MLFTPGKHFDTYNTVEECMEKIAFYLDNVKVRSDIAREGAKLVHAEHTFVHRMRRMLKIVGGTYDEMEPVYNSIAIDRTTLPEDPDRCIEGWT